ncbi:MAG: glycosyltransferase family 87 protein [Erythrobacter sp.]
MEITRWQQRLLWLVLAALTGFYFFWITRAGFWPHGDNAKLLTFDFSPVWAAGHRVLSGEALLVYDLPAHDAYQGALRGVEPPEDLPFGYPPFALWLTAPLALFDYGTAMALYLAAGFLLFAALLRKVTGDAVAAAAMALAIGGPTATIWLGQNGFLTASAITAAMLFLPQRKLAAGACLGLLTLKPHLAVLGFAALFLWREWKALGAAIATALALILLPTLVYGVEVWSLYAEAGRGIMAIVDKHYDRLIGQMMQSVYAGLDPLLGHGLAMGIQLASAAAALAATAIIPANRPNERAATLIAATLLATPYSFAYDATMLVSAVAFLLRGSRSLWLHLAGAFALLWVGSWFIQLGTVVPPAAALVLGLAIARARPLHWKWWQPVEPHAP